MIKVSKALVVQFVVTCLSKLAQDLVAIDFFQKCVFVTIISDHSTDIRCPTCHLSSTRPLRLSQSDLWTLQLVLQFRIHHKSTNKTIVSELKLLYSSNLTIVEFLSGCVEAKTRTVIAWRLNCHAQRHLKGIMFLLKLGHILTQFWAKFEVRRTKKDRST